MAFSLRDEPLGEVKIITSNEFEWKIPNFVSLSETSYCSSLFSFAGVFWNFTIYPEGVVSGKSEGYVTIGFGRNNPKPPIPLKVSFAFKTVDGKKDQERNDAEHYFLKGGEDYVTFRMISREDLLNRASELLPSNNLTVLCSAKNLDTTENASDGSLIQDLKKMLSDGRNHDLIIKIGDKELKAHQDILMARSHVFEAMLNHDMKEKNSGVIDVPDCDPEAMEEFLSYIYTGKVETDQSTMLGLYYIADKYDMQGLKNECRNFIRNSLSRTNILKVIELSVKHSDSALHEYATDYFMAHAQAIMDTAKWQYFLKENFTLGNDLLMKSFQKLKIDKN